MSTLITHDPDENPDEQSPDDDPTGVRHLLSSLPHPAPMPAYLVERIHASLAAEQARRVGTASTPSSAPVASVTPLLGRLGRRPGRLVFALAGAAAAVVLFAAVGNNVFKAGPSTVSGSASGPTSSASGPEAAGGQALTGAGDTRASRHADTFGASSPVVSIRQSATGYTRAGFVTQARNLGGAAIGQTLMRSTEPGAGTVGTAPWLTECLNAIGAGGAQAVKADLAFYEGRPAVVIVATTDDLMTAYAVGRQCSHADAAILHPATPLP